MTDLRSRMAGAAPRIGEWIDGLMTEHRAASRPVADAGYPRLRDYFPDDLLRNVRVAVVGRIPLPPLSAFGLGEFSMMEGMAAAGVTYRDVCFIHEAMASESVCCHELVHAIEWRTLGPRYLTTYAAGLLQYGYARSPLETLAFDVQSAFDRGQPVPDLVATVEARSLDAARDADVFLQAGLFT